MSDNFLKYNSEKVIIAMAIISIIILIIAKNKINLTSSKFSNFTYSILLIIALLTTNSFLIYIIGLSKHIRVYWKNGGEIIYGQLELILILYLISILILAYFINRKKMFQMVLRKHLFFWLLAISTILLHLTFIQQASYELVPTMYYSGYWVGPILSGTQLNILAFSLALIFILAQFLFIYSIIKALKTG